MALVTLYRCMSPGQGKSRICAVIKTLCFRRAGINIITFVFGVTYEAVSLDIAVYLLFAGHLSRNRFVALQAALRGDFLLFIMTVATTIRSFNKGMRFGERMNSALLLS